jgi:hypothetical protein
MKDFVDWTEVSGNSFEGNDGWNDDYKALTITTGGMVVVIVPEYLVMVSTECTKGST